MRLDFIYILRQPLSHIGESESSTSFLNTVRIFNPDNNRVEEVFCYTGNAIRGALRDCGAKHLMDKIQTVDSNFKLSKKMFHILFSGGNIVGEQKNDLNQIISLRSYVPLLSIFGAGLGNQMLSGKITQSFMFPICSETRGIVPENLDGLYTPVNVSWKQLTGSINFTRNDDLKNVELSQYSIQDDEKTLVQQMRYEIEYLVAGSQLFHKMILNNMTGLEIGAFISSIVEWGKDSKLGGMSARGFGLVDVSIYDENQEEVISIKDNNIKLCDKFINVLNEYDKFIVENVDKIKEVLGG